MGTMEISTSLILFIHTASILVCSSAGGMKQKSRCEYVQVSKWSDCDVLSMNSTRIFELLSGSAASCDKSRIETRECRKGKEKTVRMKNGIKGTKLNKKRKLKRRKKIHLKPDCRYKRGKWSSCDFHTQKLVLTLDSGSAAQCKQEITTTRACGSKLEMVETKEQFTGSRAHKKDRKNNREEHRRKRKHKNKGNAELKKKKKESNNKSSLELSSDPPAPAELHVQPHATFAIVSWIPPQHDGLDEYIPVNSYSIGYGQGFPDLHTMEASGQEVTYKIENLEPGREYIVSLRARTIWGESQPLYETIRTPEEGEESEQVILPAVGIKATVMSSEAVNVSWVDLSVNGESSKKREYFLRYRQRNHLSSSASYQDDFKTQQTSDNFVVVKYLQPFTKYEFSVMVSNGERNSSWSVIAWNTTFEDVPSTAPEDLTVIQDPENPKQIILSWQPPSEPNGILTGYEVSYNITTLDGQSLEETEVIQGNRLSVILTSLTPGLTYDFSIRARNSQGLGPPITVSNYHFLEAKETKVTNHIDPPIQLYVSVLSSTSVIVTWQNPEILDILEDGSVVTDKMTPELPTYIVRYHNLDTEPQNYTIASTPVTTLYVTDLLPLTWYEFEVKIHRRGQESPWSIPVRNRTLSVGTFQYPLKAEVKSYKMSSQAAILSWQPVLNIQVKEYVALYSKDAKQSERQWTQKTSVASNVHQYVFDSLMPETKYVFIIQAMTDTGPGPRSKILSYTTGKDDATTSNLPRPENLQVLVMSSNSALVSWYDPDLARYRGNTTEKHIYTLRYRDLNRESSVYKFASPTLPSIFMVDLEPATRYEFSVRAESGDKHSEWSNPVVNTTFESAPSSGPSHVTVVMDDRDPTTAFLTWQPPEFPNGDITGYIVFYETATERKSAAVPAGELTYRVPFLKPHTKYFFRIGARNSQGFSPLSNRVVYRTPRGTPPTDVTVSPATDDLYNAIVSWQPPSANKRKIKFYTVTHYTEDGKLRTVLKVPGFTLTTVVKKLLPSTVYHFTIQAHYQRGSGPHSEAVKYSIPKELLHDIS